MNNKRGIGLEEFFESIFPDLDPAERIEIRAISRGGPATRRFAVSTHNAANNAIALTDNHDVYYGIGLRVGAHGDKQHVSRVGSVWADVDFKHYSDGEVGAAAALERFPLPPSIVVASGGGYQPIWLLREAAESEDFAQVEAINRGLTVTLAPPGGRLDPAVDVSRVLRAPGTLNYKYDPPRRAEVIGWNPERRYNLSELEEYVPAVPCGSAGVGAADIEGWQEIDSTAALGRTLGQLRHGEAGRLFGLLNDPDAYLQSFKSPSHMDYHVVCRLVEGGLSDSEVAAVWRASALGQREKCQRDDYIVRTIASARQACTAASGGIGGFGVQDTIHPPSPEYGNLTDLLETPADLEAVDDQENEWHVKGLVGSGIALLLSALPKAGKTTFVLEMLRDACDGRSFIGLQTKPMRVLYLTEENRPSFRQALRRARLFDSEHIKIIRKHRLNRPWEAFATELPALCQSQDITVVVVDTVTRWWGLEKKGENDSATVMEAFEPLAQLAATGVAVVLVHHLRKTGGDEGTQARGSGALTAAVDIVAELRRSVDDHAHRRVLTCYSRFDETPENLVIELGDDGYRTLGDSATVALEDAKRKILAVLPDGEQEGMTRDEVAESAGVSRGEAGKALSALCEDGVVETTGRGVKGDPKRFRKRGTAIAHIAPSPESETVAIGKSMEVKQWTL